MSNNINEDISVLTTIPKYALDRIAILSRYCICHYVEQSTLEKEDITSIDIGIGELLVKNDCDGVRYKFIPSKALEKSILDTLENKKNPLINEAEKVFIGRIINTYKDLL